MFDLPLQVLSPLSDSILAEKTVTVLDDKVKYKIAKTGNLGCMFLLFACIMAAC